jgi:hypothetical protein
MARIKYNKGPDKSFYIKLPKKRATKKSYLGEWELGDGSIKVGAMEFATTDTLPWPPVDRLRKEKHAYMAVGKWFNTFLKKMAKRPIDEFGHRAFCMTAKDCKMKLCALEFTRRDYFMVMADTLEEHVIPMYDTFPDFCTILDYELIKPLQKAWKEIGVVLYRTFYNTSSIVLTQARNSMFLYVCPMNLIRLNIKDLEGVVI